MSFFSVIPLVLGTLIFQMLDHLFYDEGLFILDFSCFCMCPHDYDLDGYTWGVLDFFKIK